MDINPAVTGIQGHQSAVNDQCFTVSKELAEAVKRDVEGPVLGVSFGLRPKSIGKLFFGQVFAPQGD